MTSKNKVQELSAADQELSASGPDTGAAEESPWPPRRAKVGTTFGYTDAEGNQRELVADDDGVVRPASAEEAALLDNYDLPVARKAMADEQQPGTELTAGPDTEA